MSDDVLGRALRAKVYDVAKVTPLQPMPAEPGRNLHIWLKREDLQPTFSFKCRGAYNKIAHLDESALKRGVIAASAGNHAQGVALAARNLGAHARIVMPSTTPDIKVEAVRALGAEVILHGDHFDQALAEARVRAEKDCLTFIHPYDDADVIAGQATIGLELLQQMPENTRAIYVPVGGGGLIAGIAAVVKAVKPNVEVIGVEPRDAACLAAALIEGEPTTLAQVGIFADGVAVARIGDAPFSLVRDLVDRVVLVDTDAICAAVSDIFKACRTIAEPAGALALAGVRADFQNGLRRESDHCVAVVSGANTGFHRLGHIAERCEYGSGREMLFAASIPERPGSFHQFHQALGNHLITEFNYRRGHAEVAYIYVGIRLNPERNERPELKQQLEDHGYGVLDLSDNEIAKLHIRHMVGGRHETGGKEKLFRFLFPERPGALGNFLRELGGRWDISLFHYRNHGAAYGRVLAGFLVGESDRAPFYRFLDDLGFDYVDESDNPAYHYFLGSHCPDRQGAPA